MKRGVQGGVRGGERCDTSNCFPLVQWFPAPWLGSERSLAEAGNVSFSTRGRHYALGGAPRYVVINLGPLKIRKYNQIGTLQDEQAAMTELCACTHAPDRLKPDW